MNKKTIKVKLILDSQREYQIIATHYSNIAFQGWSACEVASPVSIYTIRITEMKHDPTSKKTMTIGKQIT